MIDHKVCSSGIPFNVIVVFPVIWSCTCKPPYILKELLTTVTNLNVVNRTCLFKLPHLCIGLTQDEHGGFNVYMCPSNPYF